MLNEFSSRIFLLLKYINFLKSPLPNLEATEIF